MKKDVEVNEKKISIFKYINKKIILLTIIIILLIISILGLTLFLNHKKEKELNSKLEKCYYAVNKDYNYNEYKNILNTIETEEGKSKAYEKLNNALANQVDELNKEYSVDKYHKLYDLMEEISKDSNEKIQEILKYNKKIYYYNDYIRMAKLHEDKGEFISAYTCYTSAIREISGIDEEKRQDANNKRDAIKNKSCENLKDEINQRITTGDYTSFFPSNYETFVNNSDDEELKKIFNQYTDTRKNIELEKEKEKKKSQGVTIGMTKQQVLDSMWGEPEKINTTTTKYGVSEQWVYPNGNYLYFENGKLTAIQN